MGDAGGEGSDGGEVIAGGDGFLSCGEAVLNRAEEGGASEPGDDEKRENQGDEGDGDDDADAIDQRFVFLNGGIEGGAAGVSELLDAFDKLVPGFLDFGRETGLVGGSLLAEVVELAEKEGELAAEGCVELLFVAVVEAGGFAFEVVEEFGLEVEVAMGGRVLVLEEVPLCGGVEAVDLGAEGGGEFEVSFVEFLGGGIDFIDAADGANTHDGGDGNGDQEEEQEDGNEEF